MHILRGVYYNCVKFYNICQSVVELRLGEIWMDWQDDSYLLPQKTQFVGV